MMLAQPNRGDVGSCEGFRMPAAHGGWTDSGGRRPKASKGRNRGGGRYGGGAGFDLPGLDGCRRNPPPQLLRYGTKIAIGKKRLLHPV
jgi:hypothetical protein